MVDENRRQRTGRSVISLACLVCGSRNYKKSKPKRNGLPPLVLQKYCKTCDQHTEHRESK